MFYIGNTAGEIPVCSLRVAGPRRAQRGAGPKGRDAAYVSAGYVSGGLRLVASVSVMCLVASVNRLRVTPLGRDAVVRG